MAKVFFSYAREDVEQVNRAKSAFEDAGHEVWLDKDIPIGVPLPQAIEIAIRSCDYFALFLSFNSKRSTWVNKEKSAYFLKDIENNEDTILPLKIDNVNLDDFGVFIKLLNICDLCSDFDVGVRAALDRITPILSKKRYSQEDYNRLLYAIDLSIIAGNTSMMYYNNCFKANVVLDDRKNAATQADKAAENKITPLVKIKYEDDVVITEESDKENPYGKIMKDGYTWVVDPLDGTINFTNRVELFCTAIGILKDGEPFIGVIFDPTSNEIYFGMNGLRSQVWKIQTGEITELYSSLNVTDLRNSVIGAHISSRTTILRKMFENDVLKNISLHFKHVRMLGSGQLALAYVASGRLQAFFQFDSYIWDQVAGAVILENSGGILKEYIEGEECARGSLGDWNYKTKNILACANQSIANGFSEKIIEPI